MKNNHLTAEKLNYLLQDYLSYKIPSDSRKVRIVDSESLYLRRGTYVIKGNGLRDKDLYKNPNLKGYEDFDEVLTEGQERFSEFVNKFDDKSVNAYLLMLLWNEEVKCRCDSLIMAYLSDIIQKSFYYEKGDLDYYYIPKTNHIPLIYDSDYMKIYQKIKNVTINSINELERYIENVTLFRNNLLSNTTFYIIKKNFE